MILPNIYFLTLYPLDAGLPVGPPGPGCWLPPGLAGPRAASAGCRLLFCEAACRPTQMFEGPRGPG